MAAASTSSTTAAARELAVVLNDLAWLLPRTIGAEASRQEPLPQSELEIMRLLSRRPGLSVAEVATELGLRSSNVSAAVRSLIARGILDRASDDVDGRVTRLTPTAEALAARDRRESSWGTELDAVLADLTDDQRRALVSASPALRALTERLSGR